jgi:uncharacterized protein YlxP (DUF503 family)
VVIGVARIVIHIPSSRSLKDKRQVVKSILARVQREFRLAAAEVDEHDRWQVAVIGLSCVSTDARHTDEIIAHAVSFVRNNLPEGDLVNYETEVIHAL